ncbi:Gtr1/RagA G protein conserved region-domain-containing protein [Gaertneriomyces semiglobifer]|nr:Gtr1/RagA G protein conserved region-domain-containing protein [Gaertneriomyces semiglobifer]
MCRAVWVVATNPRGKGLPRSLYRHEQWIHSSIHRFSEGDGLDLSDTEKPRLLLMGLRRSGKSSIQRVVFHKMSPNETLFLESTTKIQKDDIIADLIVRSFIDFQIWDFPGQLDFFDPTFDSEMIFGRCGALVFVIDAQDDYIEALQRLYMTVTRAHKVNPNISFEVFIHKVDGLSEDHKIGETQRDIHQRISDELSDAQLDNIHLSFHLTSIYDHSIYEAFSKVIQKLIPQLPTLENLLNILCSNSGIEKSFIFDVLSKIYIATDSSPVDIQSYELCSDMIDVVLDVSSIYGYDCGILSNGCDLIRNPRSPEAEPSGAAPSPISPQGDGEAHAVIRLNNGMVLYLREINEHLALVCLLREDNFEKQGLIDYNFQCFREAILDVFEIRRKKFQIMGNNTLNRQET